MLTERLRSLADDVESVGVDSKTVGLLREAADRIEVLEADVMTEVHKTATVFGAMDQQRTRIAALEEALAWRSDALALASQAADRSEALEEAIRKEHAHHSDADLTETCLSYACRAYANTASSRRSESGQ